MAWLLLAGCGGSHHTRPAAANCVRDAHAAHDVAAPEFL
jgi:hypothetical protein